LNTALGKALKKSHLLTSLEYLSLGSSIFEDPRMAQYRAIHQNGVEESQASLPTALYPSTSIGLDNEDQRQAAAGSRASLEENESSRSEMEVGKSAWTPGVWKRFPWAGAGSILLVICCMFVLNIWAVADFAASSPSRPNLVHLVTVAAVGVLIASNQSPVDKWRIGRTTIQPQVWLSVLTTIMDGLMVFVLVDGGTAYFWRQALHGIKVQMRPSDLMS
jgi:hypothetical protein